MRFLIKICLMFSISALGMQNLPKPVQAAGIPVNFLIKAIYPIVHKPTNPTSQSCWSNDSSLIATMPLA